MENDNITTNDLALMVKKGFDGMDQRFDGVERELKNIRKDILDVVYRSDFEKLETRVRDLESALEFVTKKH